MDERTGKQYYLDVYVAYRRALQCADRTATDPRVVERKHSAGCGCSMCSLRHGP